MNCWRLQSPLGSIATEITKILSHEAHEDHKDTREKSSWQTQMVSGNTTEFWS